MRTSDFLSIPDKRAILDAYLGKDVDELPTPSLVIDRRIFVENCQKMLANAKSLKADFRAHVKTHKTKEGTELQLGSGDLSTSRIIVSTLAEAWGLLPLIEEGKITDVLFSLPVVQSRLSELAEFAQKVPNLRLMVDSAEQLDVLENFFSEKKCKPWSIFVKINMGTNRAGLVNDSDGLAELLGRAFKDDKIQRAVNVYGFYCHAGHSYASKSVSEAQSHLFEEIKHANKAAARAVELLPSLKDNLVISVGATPTAHSSASLTHEHLLLYLGDIQLAGQLELHAGNYPFCDLQQVATGCVGIENVSASVLAEVVTMYPGRGSQAPGEQLINAGVLGLTREAGPLPGYGNIVLPEKYSLWYVGRLSQEHGILVPSDAHVEFIPPGTKVRVVPQHSCITAASYPWHFVVENNNVVDVWVPFLFW